MFNKFFKLFRNDTKKLIKIYLINKDYNKVLRVIKSCQCEEHLAVANRLITCFYMKNGSESLLKKLENKFKHKKQLINKI